MVDCGCMCCGCETYWIGADYLGWQLDGTYIPALVTTSPAGTPNPGRLGDPTTQIVSGDTVGVPAFRSLMV